MTGDALRQAVRDLVGVGNAAAYPRLTDANINAYVDVAMNRLAIKAEPLSLQSSYTTTLTAADSTYELSSVALRIYTVSIVGQSRALMPISYAELERDYPTWRDAEGTSSHYIIEGVNASGAFALKLWPTPPATVSNGLVVRFLAEPTSLGSISSGEVVQWPEYVQDGFACYAAFRTIIRFTERGVADPRAAAIKNEWDNAAALFLEQESIAHPQQWGHCVVEPGAHDLGIELPW